MAHLVLSRKYRPQRFEDLVGQEHVARTLSNAITSGRIGHAYLFVGPRGTGKTTTARILARALNCVKGPTPTPCGACPSCVDVAAGVDLDVVELDAASHNGVDDVRALRDSVGYQPARSRFRVWVVDEVHMLSTPAFNAFLKTLEEPPPQAKFVFCTTEAHKLPETFTSRVQRLEFRRIAPEAMATRLLDLAAREGVEVEAGVCERIAAGALGGLRDGESLLEQLLAASAGGRLGVADLDALLGRAAEERVAALLAACEAGDPGEALRETDRAIDAGAKPDVLLDQVLDALRAAMRAACSSPPSSSPSSSPRSGPAGAGQGAPRAAPGLARAARGVDLLLEKRARLREGADPRLVAEVAVVELARLPSAHDLDEILVALRAGGERGSGERLRSEREAPAPTRRDAPTPGPRDVRSGSPPAGAARPAEPDRRDSRAVVAAVAVPREGATTGVRPVEVRFAENRPADPRLADPRPADPRAADLRPADPRAADLRLADVEASWDAVCADATRRSRRLGTVLARARPAHVAGDVLSIALGDSDAPARAALRDREVGEAFRAATLAVLGAALRAAPFEGPAPAPTSSPSPPSSPRAPVATDSPAAAPPARPPAPPSGPAESSQPRAPSRSAAAPPSGDGTPREDLRTSAPVRAVADLFGARVLSVERTAQSDAGNRVEHGAGRAEDRAGSA